MDYSAEAFARAAAQASRASGVPIELTGHAALGPVLAAARFVLANGLTIVLAPDHRAPIFAYQSWFKVGSKHEDPARTGLAHLFEHLMFKGTTKYSAGTFDQEMERRGSQTNAATWVDWTYYTEALAARGDNLATVIAFEADRMVNLVLDEATFRSELEVVKNERRMSVEDSIGGLLGEELLALAYTEHPYRWPTIGSMAHLEAASLADLRSFYRANYAPNNATVVVVGDLEPAATLVALAGGYAHLAPQPLPARPRIAEPPQTAPRARLLRRPMLAPQLVIGYRAPAQGDPHYPAAELLAEALTAGDTGRLYRRLVITDQLAADVSGFVAPFAEPGLFELHVGLRPDVDPERVVAVVQEEVDALRDGLRAEELDKGRNGLELALLDGLKDVEGRAEALGHYETNFGAFERAFCGVEAWHAVGTTQIGEVAARLFDRRCRSVVVAVPEEGTHG